MTPVNRGKIYFSEWTSNWWNKKSKRREIFWILSFIFHRWETFEICNNITIRLVCISKKISNSLHCCPRRPSSSNLFKVRSIVKSYRIIDGNWAKYRESVRSNICLARKAEKSRNSRETSSKILSTEFESWNVHWQHFNWLSSFAFCSRWLLMQRSNPKFLLFGMAVHVHDIRLRRITLDGDWNRSVISPMSRITKDH